MATAVLPRGPRGHFLSGHLSAFKKDWLGFVTRVAREYGDIMESCLVLATLAQRFHFCLVPNQTIALWPSITLRPGYGIKVVLQAKAAGPPTGSSLANVS